MTATDPRMRRLLALLYLAGALIAVDQIADLLATLLANPVSLDSAQWRFGAFGLAATRGSVLLVADILLFAAALGLDHARVLRVLGAVNLLVAVGVVAALVLFTLDAVQFRRMIKADASRRYLAAALRAGGISVLGTVLLVWSGLAALRLGRQPKGKKSPGSVLIDGGTVKEGRR